MKRALLIGSEIGGLSGVHADVRLVDQALTCLGFETRPIIEGEATADGILGQYRELIEDTTRSDDVAVVYYSGHGGQQPNPLWEMNGTLPQWLQYIVPTDFDNRSGGRVRCILAEELSLLQRELTAKSRNVTVILDCCHSARMSRYAALIPKAIDQLVTPGGDLAQRWKRLYPPAREADDNHDAVRVVACGPNQVAFEAHYPSRGRRHGVLTAALADVLTHPAMGSWTWLDALEILRREVPEMSLQRPAVEGPADRMLFSLNRRGGSGVLPVRVEHGIATLPDAAIFGVAVGDSYALVEPGRDVAAPLAIATVHSMIGGRAVLQLDGITVAELPELTTAWPRGVALGRHAVAVRGPAGLDRQKLETRLQRSVRVRPSDDVPRPLATLSLDEHGVQVLDAVEQPLYHEPLTGANRIAAAVADVERLALAEHVRALPDSDGAAALASDVTVSLVCVLPNGREIPVTSGMDLFVRDLLQFSAVSTVPGRYVSVFDIGIAGAVTQLTTSEPDGVTLTPHLPYELGRDWGGGGIPLSWPAAVPETTPRAESLLVIVTDAKVDRLADLGQRGVSRGPGSSTSALARLISDVSIGRRDLAVIPGRRVRHQVERFDFLLHPTTRPTNGQVDQQPGLTGCWE